MNLHFTGAADVAVSTQGLALSYGETAVLRGVDLELKKGSTLALLGPSGCGKTTLLRLLAGLLAPSRGSVALGGEVVADARTGKFVPPEKRGLGMVFQDYALWPHLSVNRNVAFPLEMRGGFERAEIGRRVDEALKRVGLHDYGRRSPGDLSGGQQQRVAIARAIVGEPRLVLFDEPLSNLDRELREQLALELAELVRGLSLTAVYVTHDQSEAFTVADAVAVMQGGEIAQLASPQILVEAPATAAIAEFLKLGAVLDAERRADAWWLAGTDVRLAGGGAHETASTRARVLLARKALRLVPTGEATTCGKVAQAQFRGDAYSLSVALGADRPVLAQAVSASRHAAGDEIGIVIDPHHLRWFPAR
jgi:iron(III) transport system ATP-binding protein